MRRQGFLRNPRVFFKGSEYAIDGQARSSGSAAMPAQPIG
jgi:hypothetical protein